MNLTHFYTRERSEEGRFFVTLCDESHPIFQAHFPSHPIVPGFVLMQISAELLGVTISHVKKAKFIQSVAPQSHLCFEVTPKEKTYKIIIVNNTQKVAELIYEAD